MTAYIANHQKKKAIFEKREQELKHAIQHEFSDQCIEKAAEKLRAAKLAIFKMKFSRDSVLPASSYVPNEEAVWWKNRPLEEIVDEYRKS